MEKKKVKTTRSSTHIRTDSFLFFKVIFNLEQVACEIVQVEIER